MGKYSFKQDVYSSHMKIIAYLKGMPGKRLRILDVGCSKGFIGNALHKEHDFYGIDYDKKDAKIAGKYYRDIKIADLEKDKLVYREKFFDVIIMADIIEHLKDPPSIVSYFRFFLKENGVLILSVPNIANIYVRLKLLFGNFDYEKKGIMDKTHMRFFTLKSIRKLVKDAGLSVEKEDFTPIPLPLVNSIFSRGRPLHIIHKFNYLLTRLWKTLFSYQIILYCKK